MMDSSPPSPRNDVLLLQQRDQQPQPTPTQQQPFLTPSPLELPMDSLANALTRIVGTPPLSPGCYSDAFLGDAAVATPTPNAAAALHQQHPGFALKAHGANQQQQQQQRGSSTPSTGPASSQVSRSASSVGETTNPQSQQQQAPLHFPPMLNGPADYMSGEPTQFATPQYPSAGEDPTPSQDVLSLLLLLHTMQQQQEQQQRQQQSQQPQQHQEAPPSAHEEGLLPTDWLDSFPTSRLLEQAAMATLAKALHQQPLSSPASPDRSLDPSWDTCNMDLLPPPPPQQQLQHPGTAEVSNGNVEDISDVELRSLFNADTGLNLSLFKGLKCHAEGSGSIATGGTHDRKNCPFYHSNRDRRRLPVFYKAEQCEAHFDFDNEGSVCVCSRGDDCDRCHNRHELLYHPKIYKQRFCSSYKTMQLQSPLTTCHRGRFCAFAHSRDEIRCNLFTEEEEKRPAPEFFMNRFKTFWCPYGIQHDWHGCLYAHTYQDCRRSPAIGYGSEPCPYWQKDLHSADYHKRCPFGARCPYAHGSKEQLYHPGYYKSMPCADYKARRSCPRGSFCAFYHDVLEKRRSAEESDVVYDYSRPVPDERIVFLQQNFMAPPLFNLDDFEAFGHYSRTASGEQLSRSHDDFKQHKQRQVSGNRHRQHQQQHRSTSNNNLCRSFDQLPPMHAPDRLTQQQQQQRRHRAK